MESCVILGSSIAGLSAANYLVDHGRTPLIIETEPKQPSCNEFFSSAGIPILRKWNIPFLKIARTHIISKKQRVSFGFQKPAATVSRALCKDLLKKRALQNGAELLTGAYIKQIVPSWSPNGAHYVILSSNELVKAHTLIITTHMPDVTHNETSETSLASYYGIKTHFQNLELGDETYLYLIDGGYIWLSSVEDSKTAFVCLADAHNVSKTGGARTFIQHQIESIPRLADQLSRAKCLYEWFVKPIPFFGVHKTYDWPRICFAGDAAAKVWPATGKSLWIALSSGILAAQHTLYNDNRHFSKIWHTTYNNQLTLAKITHDIFTQPNLANAACWLTNRFPRLTNFIQHQNQC